MFVGGEFYYDGRWLAEHPTISTSHLTFLNGGKACLAVISETLLDHGIKAILLPSYLCPTIVNTLERCGLDCEYYQVNPDFSIDLDDLAGKAGNHRAVYFINYFGFFHGAETLRYLESLRKDGKLVIEDNAQAGFCDQTTGDFVFNSMRKLSPYDGGYLGTRFDVTAIVQEYQNLTNRHLPVIREYRQRLADYLFSGKGRHGELQQLYNLAEEYYEADLVVAGDPQEQHFIERLDWDGIKKSRRENYAYLLGLLSGLRQITPIFPALQEDNQPLGLPVYVNPISRDQLFDALGSAGIGLTIHWDGLLSDPRLNGNPVAVDMASRILTLVIDQRTTHKQMDTLVQTIHSFIRDPSASG